MSRILIDKPPYRTQDNRWITRSLFYEQFVLYPQQCNYEPRFTLGYDIPGLVNARQTFIELRDPTGYKWAIKYLGSWDHWTYLLRSPWFQEAYEEWLQELKTIFKMEAIDRIKEIASEGSAQSFLASKYLASAEWEKAVRGPGAPSKAEMKGELKKAVQALTWEEEDAKRMGLKVIQGDKI